MCLPNCCAVIVAAGNSTRMGGNCSKQFLSLCGIPAIARTLLAFEHAKTISSVVVAGREEDFAELRALFQNYGIKKVTGLAVGGNTRQHSVSAGIAAAPREAEFFAIHDGARALILPEEIDRVVMDAAEWGAATLAAPVKDTIKLADEKGFVASTPERSLLWAVQTPQVFAKQLYVKAMRRAEEEKANYTDDCQLVEHTGVAVHLCKGSYTNLKLTTPEDLFLAEAIIKDRGR